MKHLLQLLDRLFSFFVLIVIVFLAVYMGMVILQASVGFLETIILGDFLPEEENRQMLHGIAATVIFIKAYRILVSYLRTHHVSLEYIVEISVIAPAIELLFAYDVHDTETKLIFAAFGLINLFLYLHYFGPEHDEMLHADKKKGHR